MDQPQPDHTLPGGGEAELVARALGGDEAAWEVLVRVHQEPVFRLAYLLIGDGPERAAAAEDVTQEAFVRAFLNLQRYDDSRPLRPWLLAIAANLARNRRRSVGRYWHALRQWWQVRRVEQGSAADTRRQQDDAQVLAQAIERLPESQRQVLYLRYFLDLPETEMADVLAVAPGTVKSRLYRARQALHAVLHEEFPALYETWAGAASYGES